MDRYVIKVTLKISENDTHLIKHFWIILDLFLDT